MSLPKLKRVSDDFGYILDYTQSERSYNLPLKTKRHEIYHRNSIA